MDPKSHNRRHEFLDIRLLPFSVTILSGSVLATTIVARCGRPYPGLRTTTLSGALYEQWNQPKGRSITVFKAGKALLAAILLAVSLYTEAAFVEGKTALVRASLVLPVVSYTSPRSRIRTHESIQAYGALLSSLAVVTPASAALHLQTRGTLVLLSVFASYAYRNLWPLLTTRLQPLDVLEGPFLWAKIVLCLIVSALLPVLQPFPYMPVDPWVNSGCLAPSAASNGSSTESAEGA
jgi:hypothetical protein